MKKIILKYQEIILYLLFGFLTTLVNILIYYICTKILNIDYQISNIIAWIISVTFAFITNKIFVFASKNNIKKTITEMISFYSFRLISLGFDIAIMFIAVSLINMNDILAKVLSNIFVIIINYIFSKLFIFKKNKRQ